MSPIEPRSLLQRISREYLPPPAPPLPVLKDVNVTEPPLPAVSGLAPTTLGHDLGFRATAPASA